MLGCGAREVRFPLREPMMRDGDLASVRVGCRAQPTPKDPKHISCAPEPYKTSLYWDGGDNLFFRPLSDSLGVSVGAESIDVNSIDEVPDSAWFTNRIDKIGPAELRRGACSDKQLLDPEHAPDGAWLIDKGKDGGSTSGFRITVPGKGKYLIKFEDIADEPERQSASSVIGASVVHAAGYYSACEQVLWVRPSLFKLTPGLTSRANFASPTPLDQEALAKLFAQSPHRGDRARVAASAWISGYAIGSFRYEGTRGDDPNDVVPHEDRRELRGMRLLAAWIGRVDAREANTFDAWVADDPRVPDSSPGHVLHYHLDLSETLGAYWAWTSVSRRLGHSYFLDWKDTSLDLVTLGARPNEWDRVRVTPGQEIFGYFDVDNFTPENWKAEYPNAAFSRMTERDGAWMARILARFTPPMVRALAETGDFTNPSNTNHLERVLEGRLERILERYLTRLSPLADVRVEGGNLCAVDLAERRGLRPASQFQHRAHTDDGRELVVTKRGNGELCVTLPREPYVRVVIENGVAKGPLVAHLWDRGQTGFTLVGIERR
jgi:hypothetical protein